MREIFLCLLCFLLHRRDHFVGFSNRKNISTEVRKEKRNARCAYDMCCQEYVHEYHSLLACGSLRINFFLFILLFRVLLVRQEIFLFRLRLLPNEMFNIRSLTK